MADLQKNPGLYDVGEKFTVTAEDLTGATLNADTEVTVWSKQIPQDKVGFFGHGPEDRRMAEAYIYAKLVASGNGTGTGGDAINGELVAAITDSEQRRVLASMTVDALGELADAESSERTDRPVFAALAPFARAGRHLEFRIVANSSSDGVELDNAPANSSARLYYSQA